MIIVVLGMHKSGTTLVSQILHHSGINMGEFDPNVSYDKGNKYERQDALHLDMEILGTTDYEVLDLTPGGRAHMDEGQRAKMNGIIAHCGANNPDWGFKDPRACLTYDLWAEELPEHKIVAVFRDPAEVWPRFKWLGLRKHHTNFSRALSYLERWQEHNLNIIGFIKETKMDYLVLNYNDLMSGPEAFANLEKFIGRPLKDTRKPGLYRSRAKADIFLKWGDWAVKKQTGKSIGTILEKLEKLKSQSWLKLDN